MPAKKSPAKKKTAAAKKPAKNSNKKSTKQLPPRVAVLAEDALTPPQRALLDSIRSGPRGGGINIRGPFAVFLHAPAFGELAQQLGGHCRYSTAVSPRLSEFAILVTAKLWRAQYEWFAHVPQAERAGVKKADDQRSAQGTRAEVGAQGRARDLRLHPGALQDQARERQEFQARQSPSSASRRPSSSSASSATTC